MASKVKTLGDLDMKTKISISLLIASFILMGCNPTKQEVGTVIGAGTGALIGSQIGGGKGQLAAVAIGTLVGSYLGGKIGADMDELDRYRTQSTLESTPTGQSVEWQNPDNYNQYKVTPTKTYESNSGPCRDYTTEAVIDGRPEIVHGTACRQSDGRWYAMN